VSRRRRLAGLVPPPGGPSKAKAAALAAEAREALAGAPVPASPAAPPAAAPAPEPPAVPVPPAPPADDWAEERNRLLEEVESLRACLAEEERESARRGVALEDAERAREEADQARKEAETTLEEARKEWHDAQDERDEEAAEKTRSELVADIEDVLLSADRRLVEYHGRRLGLELLPMHGRAVA
jgi:hypothetical protein